MLQNFRQNLPLLTFSARNIAGILSENHRVLGMMPHPERAVEVATGGDDGRGVFEGVLAA